MTTDVDTALEVVAAAVAGMALLIVLLVLAEQLLLRPPASSAAPRPRPSRAGDEGAPAITERSARGRRRRSVGQ